MAIGVGTPVFSNEEIELHTFAVTVAGSDTYLLVAVAQHDVNINSVTYNGDALALLATHFSHPIYVSVYGLANPDAGTHDVVVDYVDSSGIAIGAIPFTGVHQTVSTGTAGEANGTGTAPTVNVSSATDELVVDCLFTAWSAGTAALTAGAGQTERIDQGAIVVNGTARAFGMSTEAGAATTTMSWTADINSSDIWVTVAVPLKPSAVAITESEIANASKQHGFFPPKYLAKRRMNVYGIFVTDPLPPRVDLLWYPSYPNVIKIVYAAVSSGASAGKGQ